MNKTNLVIAALIIVGVGAWLVLGNGGPSLSDKLSLSQSNTVDTNTPRIYPDVPRDAIPPLDTPRYVPITEIENRLNDEDFLLVTLFGSQPFAYPNKIMNFHEIVNDQLEGIKFAATYCPLCRSGIVFDRVLDSGQEVTFGNTGSLYENAMVMYDRQTDSQWAHVNGTAITGPLKGQTLNILPSTMITFAKLKADHPNALVLSFDTGFERSYDQDPFASYERQDNNIPFPISTRDDRLSLKTRVLGLSINGQAKAYPITVKAPPVLEDTLGGQNVRIEFDTQTLSATAFDTNTNEPLPQINAFWFGWSIAHPDTKIANY